MVDIACASLHVDEVVARVDPANTPSVGLLHRLGMVKVGERLDVSGVVQHIYGIACQEWERGHPTRSIWTPPVK